MFICLAINYEGTVQIIDILLLILDVEAEI